MDLSGLRGRWRIDTRAVMQTREFLRELCDSEHMPGVPDDLRRQARHLRRHYPEPHHVNVAAVAWPGYWAPERPERGQVTPPYLELLARVRRDSLGHAAAAPATSDGEARMLIGNVSAKKD